MRTLKQPLSFIISAVVLITCVVFVVLTSQQIQPKKKFEAQGIAFDYPQDYSRQKTDTAIKSEGSVQLLSAVRKTPAGVMMVNKGEIDEKAVVILKMSQLDIIEKNAEQKFALTYSNYKKISAERRVVDGRDALVIKFQYTGKDKKTTIFMRYAAVVADKIIYYITLQSTNDQSLNSDSNIVLNSVKISV